MANASSSAAGIRKPFAFLMAFAGSGCSPPATVEAVPVETKTIEMPARNPIEQPIALPPDETARPRAISRVVRGSGMFVGRPAAAEADFRFPGEPVTLDFVNADIRDVVRSVFGDVLKVPYLIDPSAQGTITLQSGGPISRSRIVTELSGALRLANLAVVQNEGVFKIVPLAQASREVQITTGGATGFVARIITPRYVAASELERLLQPLVPGGTSLRAEPSRNVLIVSGPAQDVAGLLGNLAVFDVDTMRGMSTALLPLSFTDAREVKAEVDSLLSSTGDTEQLVHVVPLERMNALLVTAMRPDYVERVRRWVEDFDKGGSSSEHQLFVYDVQNGRAADLGDVLRKALGLGGQDAPSTQSSAGRNASYSGMSGGGAGMIGSLPGSSPNGSSTYGQSPILGGLSATGASVSSFPAQSSALVNRLPGTQAGVDDQAPAQPQSEILVTADPINNALLIRATSQEYKTIDAALRRLDIPQLQVMLEATIAEVTLTNQLAYGLQYYVKSGNLQALFAAPVAGTTSTSFSGFNFSSGLNVAYGTLSGSTAILQLLQQLTQVRVLSSPTLFVSNNQAARIQVGDQVPIATGSATSTLTSGAPIVNSIEYRDTGIILKVTPRVNASGIVSLDVGEEVSSVSSTTTSSLNSPTISERRLDTTVSIGDGQTVALGGLISDNRTQTKNGIPILQSLPGLGWLFGQRNDQINRTELIAILTPHVVRTPTDMRAITEELQRKLPLTYPVRLGRP